MTTPTPTALNVSDLRGTFAGELILPGDDAYDEARRVWNAMVDHRPALIARCTSAADVAAAIGFGRAVGLEIGVRCGGHSVLGLAMPEGGVAIDLSPMRNVHVDRDRRIAHVQGGALLGDLDRAAQAHGLATTAGNVSHTGVGGLTLGGGMGWLGRQFGLACDNVISAEVVTADGDALRASATEHPDLYWALRGGGGNFGVVTDFEFQLHPVAPPVLSVDIWFDADDATDVLRGWRDLLSDAPTRATMTAWVGTTAPTWDFLPAELRGRPLSNAGFVWVGNPEEGRSLVPAVRDLASPLAETIDEMTYLGLQSSADVPMAHGMRRYWKGHYFRDLTDAAIDAFISRGGEPGADGFRPNGSFQSYGGAIAEVADDETAFSHRDALVEFVSVSTWTDAAEDAARIAAARRFGAAMQPFSSGVYVNGLADEGEAGVRAAYRPHNLERLAAIKARYDPDNVLHLNHNIRPAT
ncbi:MAG: FAD-binding oxidoreductase, partial [Candidatus Limnocylindria bacterium]